jgi:hypothetical protein
MRDQLGNANKLFCLEIELHVSGMLLEVIKQLLRWGPHNVVNFIDLVKFVVSREEREEGEDLEEDTPGSPNVHFIAIITVR